MTSAEVHCCCIPSRRSTDRTSERHRHPIGPFALHGHTLTGSTSSASLLNIAHIICVHSSLLSRH